MSRRFHILHDSVRYISSSYVAQVFDVAAGILTRRLLGPALMGVWTFCQVLISYAKYSAFGTTDATVRDIPYYLAKGEEQKAVEIQNLVFSFTLTSSFLVAIGFWIYALFAKHRHSEAIVVSLFASGFIIVLQRAHNLLVCFLRAYKKFGLISRQTIYSSILSLVLITVFSYSFKLYGYLVALVLTYIGNIVFIQFFARFPIRFYFHFERLKPILSLGVPLLVIGILNAFLFSLDKIFITKYLGFEALGYYSVALMAQNFFFSLPNMLAIVIYPYFQEQYALHEHAGGLNSFVFQPMIAMAALLLIPLGLIWILSPPLIHWILPKFIPGIAALKILLLATFFKALAAQPANFLVTARKHWLLIPINLISIAMGFLFLSTAMNFNLGIEGVAMAMGFCYLFQLVISLGVGVRANLSVGETLRFGMIAGVNFLYGTLVLMAINQIHFSPEILSVFLQLLLFVLLLIPVLCQMEKITGALTLIWGYVKKKVHLSGAKP